MKDQKRLLGIDLCKGLAAYTVVLLHSGDQTSGTVDFWASQLRSFSYYAVPFFLTTAFYFMICKVNINTSLKFWMTRVKRLLIPYLTWTIIYVVSKFVLSQIGNQGNRLDDLWHDPMSIVFFGGASIQLYFLPLLLTGTTLIILAEYLVRKEVNIKSLIVFAISSIAVSLIVSLTGNAFHLESGIAFQQLFNRIIPDLKQEPVIRFLLVQIAWLIVCLPYLLISMILRSLVLGKKFIFSSHSSNYSLIFLMLFVLTGTLGRVFLPKVLVDVAAAYTFLLFGICSSSLLEKSSRIVLSTIKNLGICSFGIYLIHPFLLNFFEILLKGFWSGTEVTLFSLLLISIPTFLISWAIVSVLLRYRSISGLLFSA